MSSISTILDLCNPIIASCASCTMLLIIIGLQMMGSNTGIGCLPVLDYLKFATVFIIIYFAYENIIKQNSLICGINGFPLWSSICCSVIMSSIILILICAKLRGGMISNIGYLPMICLFCLTICCTARLYKTNGPLSASFFDPATLATFEI
jgi:hypothetical protein